MDQPGSSSGQSTSSKVQSDRDINHPSHPSPLRGQPADDSSTLISDSIIQQPARSHAVGRSPTVEPLDPSSVQTAPRRPSPSLPVVNVDPITPAAPPPQAAGRSEERVRKKLLWLSWSFIFNGVQIGFIIDLLMVSSGRSSTTDPHLSEWAACPKPLGAWDAVWAVKLCCDILLSFWSFREARAIQLSSLNSVHSDIESGRNAPNNQPLPVPTAPDDQDSTPPTIRTSPHSSMRKRLSVMSNMCTIVWFSVTNPILFSSIATCRVTSPHLWWLTFSLLAVIYLMILPFFFISMTVFVLIPFVFMVCNTFLLCIGRPPLRIPYVQSGVGKLPKSIVDGIPLVIYIPPPPDDDASSNQPITKPEPIYEYPPKATTPTPPKRRFAFLRTKPSQKGTSGEKDKDSSGERKTGESWEDNWEHGKYPFVRLEGNRATCAICLMDFEEPKRTKQENEGSANHMNTKTTQENQIQVVNQEDRLTLEDPGEGAQPLRLLTCGHVFHQTCLDPWLIGVSGRCPMCQRPVELPSSKQRSKRTRNP